MTSTTKWVSIIDHTMEMSVAFRVGARLGAKAMADALAENTRRKSPVGDPSVDPHSGQLKASWRVEGASSLLAPTAAYAVVSDDPVAVYQEFGTSKMAAHPSLGPAAHEESLLITAHNLPIFDGLIKAAGI